MSIYETDPQTLPSDPQININRLNTIRGHLNLNA